MAISGVRFAPSPTGRFHVGNLRTAWVSWQWAQRLKTPWVIRFEDIDKPRVVRGAREQQLADLAILGLQPDLVHMQSENYERHAQYFRAALLEGKIYPCMCSRKDVLAALAQMASAPHGDIPLYSGHCRHKPVSKTETNWSDSVNQLAWRFKMPVESGAEDFIIGRTEKSGRFDPSYHWACAIDDFEGRFKLLVRSVDLRSAAKFQREIHRWLGIHSLNSKSADSHKACQSTLPPAIFHTSLVADQVGHRLEKRTQGVTLAEIEPARLLEAFKTSFDWLLLREELLPSEIRNETPEILRITDLGL